MPIFPRRFIARWMTSRLLIVICSPRVVASTYVTEEIRYFKKIGGEDRVLAVMVEGEPNASRDAGKQSMGFRVEDECFPDALRQSFGPDGAMREVLTEPIAADFRLGQEQGWTSPEAYRQAMRRDDVLSAREIERRVEEYRQRSHLMLLENSRGHSWRAVRPAHTTRQGLSACQGATPRATRAPDCGRFRRARSRSRSLRQSSRSVQYRAAEKSKREAQAAAERATHARHEAEKLVEFMVFDLRDKLNRSAGSICSTT